jgi:hypothetical protein
MSRKLRDARASDAAVEICTLRIELLDSDPLIWRELEVPTSITLEVLNQVVQAAMSWDNSHLWEFSNGGRRYSPPSPWGDSWSMEPPRQSVNIRLRDLLGPRRTTIGYTYDFVDCWEHRLILTRIRPGEPDVGYPRYVAGECNAPPEDCGGIPGFYAALDAVADPADPEHDHWTEWLGDYDPKRIDELSVKTALARIAGRRNAGRKRLSANAPSDRV